MANEQINPSSLKGKTCRDCGVFKPLQDFPSERNFGRPYCKECKNLKTALFRAAHPNARDGEYKRYYEANKEKENKRVSEWAKANPQRGRDSTKRYAEKNRDAVKQKEKEWKLANRPYATAMESKRRAAKLQACPKWLNAGHHAEIWGYYLFISIFKGLQVDHVYPIQGKEVRGLHVPWNLDVLTLKENATKNNRMPDPTTIAPYIERPTLIIDADGFASLKFED